jgi:hypothetical protein
VDDIYLMHFASDQREHLMPHLRYHLWSVQRFSENITVTFSLLCIRRSSTKNFTSEPVKYFDFHARN